MAQNQELYNWPFPPPQDPQQLADYVQGLIRSMAGMNLRSGATGFKAGTGYFVGAASGNQLVTSSGQQIADSSGARVYSGVIDGTPVFYVGSAGGHSVSWDGATLAVVGEITATSGELKALIVTDALSIGTGGSLRSGQTGFDQGSGFWMDYNNGTPRLSIGSSDGNKLTWDGQNLKVGKSQYTDGTQIDSFQPAQKGADATAGNLCGAGSRLMSGTCYDGVAVTFPQAFSATPEVWLLAGGTGGSSTEGQQYQALNRSATGFTPSLKWVDLSSGTSSQTDNFSPTGYTTSSSLSLTAPSINDSYTANFSVQIITASQKVDSCTVTLYVNGSAAWSKTYPGLDGDVFDRSEPMALSGLSSGDTIELKATGSGEISATTFTYTTGTAPSSRTATPAGAPGVRWIAYPSS